MAQALVAAAGVLKPAAGHDGNGNGAAAAVARQWIEAVPGMRVDIGGQERELAVFVATDGGAVKTMWVVPENLVP